jgi:HemY protein
VRLAIWFLLLFAVAVVAAATLGANDGLASFYLGAWRLDLSLNFFVLLLIGTCFLLVAVFQAINALIGMPQRAREWRTARRDRTGQAALREGLAQYFGGRYTRAQKAAQRALAIQAETPELAQDNEFTVLGHLLAAGSAHRLQNRTLRDQELGRALELAQHSASARSAEEGARLLAAEWALDDRDAPRAIELLNALPHGVARRTHALRLKLQAARLGGQPQEALKTARLLIKHQGFSTVAAAGLGPFARVRSARRGARHRPAAQALDVARRRRSSRSLHRRARRSASERARQSGRRAHVASSALGRHRRARARRPLGDRRGVCRRGERDRARVAAAPRCRVAGAAARRRGRARRRSGARRARSLGQVAGAARASGERRSAADDDASQGLDRPRRARDPRERCCACSALFRERRTRRLNAAAVHRPLRGSSLVSDRTPS